MKEIKVLNVFSSFWFVNKTVEVKLWWDLFPSNALRNYTWSKFTKLFRKVYWTVYFTFGFYVYL